MVRLINARQANGDWLDIEIAAGRITSARVGGNPSKSQVVSPIPLMSVGDFSALPDSTVVDAGGRTLLPAAIDVHVHSRDPGLTHKEDWHSLARGAWRGGVIAVADMPNTLPPTMTKPAVIEKAERARASGLEHAFFLGVGLSNINELRGLLLDSELPLCGLKVFYGRTTGELLYDDLETLARMLPDHGEKVVVFHSEDQCTIDCNHKRFSRQLHDTNNAAFSVHSEIRSSDAAHTSTRTILEWARTTYRRPIHIAHISTALEVELVAEARSRGVPVTCEVAPHHLLFSTADYERLGPLVKMNPPLRSPEEVEALSRLFAQGAIDIFATDHAPHTLAEKYADVAHSPSGVPGVELFYQLLIACSKRFGLSLDQAVEMASAAPARLLGWKHKGSLTPGRDADFVVLGDEEHTILSQDVVSKCGWTPYAGWHVPRDVVATWNRGRQVYCGPNHETGVP